jgi:hypothetical protein
MMVLTNVQKKMIEEENEKIEKTNKNVNSIGFWKMFFDDASSWEGSRSWGVVCGT